MQVSLSRVKQGRKCFPETNTQAYCGGVLITVETFFLYSFSKKKYFYIGFKFSSEKNVLTIA
jgi:hypothetical protein